MQCCVIPGGQTDAASSQKRFLPFHILLSFGIDPNFPQKLFFSFILREISLSGEKILSLATQITIIYHKGQTKVYELITEIE